MDNKELLEWAKSLLEQTSQKRKEVWGKDEGIYKLLGTVMSKLIEIREKLK